MANDDIYGMLIVGPLLRSIGSPFLIYALFYLVYQGIYNYDYLRTPLNYKWKREGVIGYFDSNINSD
jgi:hypothetical protein